MASTQDIQNLLAQLAQSTIATQTQIDALAAEVRGLAANTGAVPGAAPPVLALQSATQTVRKSSETTVHLSLSDDEYDSRHQRVMRPPTQNAIRQLTLAVSNLAANVGAVPGAAPPVLLQTVRKSPGRLFSGKLLEKRRIARQQRDDAAVATNDAIRAT